MRGVHTEEAEASEGSSAPPVADEGPLVEAFLLLPLLDDESAVALG